MGGGQQIAKNHKNHKILFKNSFFDMCFPWKGTLTDAGDGLGGEGRGGTLFKKKRRTLSKTIYS